MREQKKSLRKDERGFTGLEAGIVLTAFVIIAAVFSYVVLNAGFFSSQKAEEVVHTGIEQVTSSFEPAGDVIAHGWTYNASGKTYYDATGGTWGYETDSTNLTVVQLYLTLTAGQTAMDMDKLTIAYSDRDMHAGALNYTKCNYSNFTEDSYPNEAGGERYPTYNVSKGNMSMGNWTYYTADTPGAVHNSMLEAGEMVAVLITLPDYGVTANKKFTIELKPAIGPVIIVPRTSPGQVDETMTLH
jgi:flagellin FlaB